MKSSSRVSAWRITIIALALVSMLASCALAGTVITGLKVANSKDQLTISISANGPIKMGPIVSTSGRFLAFHIRSKMAVKGRLMPIRSGRVYNVRYSNFSTNPPASRLVINTNAAVDYCTDWSTDRKSVKIRVFKFGRPSVARAATAKQVLPVLPIPELSVNPIVAEIERSQMGSDSGESIQPVLKRYDPQPVRLADAQPAVPAVEKIITPISAERPERSQRKVSLNFLGADINDVLKALSVQSNYNIVSSKDVTGNITISLSNVDVETALDYIAKLSGYSYAKLDDTYVVGKRDSVRSLSENGADESRVEVISLSYAKLDDLVAFLEKEFPEMKFVKGSKDAPVGEKKEDVIEQRGGVLILSGPNNVVDQAKSVALSVDSQMKEMAALNVTEVYKVRYVNPKNLAFSIMNVMSGRVVVSAAPNDGFDLKAPSKIEIDAKGGASVKEDTAPKEESAVRAILITGKDPDVKQALELAAKLDMKTPQIKIDAKITSINETGEKKLGVKWEWGNAGQGTLGWIEGSKIISSVTGGGDDSSSSVTTGGNKRWARVPWDFTATLEAIVQNGDGKILASPSITCLEGKPGVFFVGNEVTYITLVQVTPTGTNVTTEKANVGVQLRASGNVNEDGFITLNLHPEVSVLKLDYNEKAGIYTPIITRRFTDHVVRLKNGQTIVIGGLIREDEIEEMTKIPFLGDIPLLGKLFKHTDRSKERTEVVMILTASVVEE